MIQGYNWTITDVSVTTPVTDEDEGDHDGDQDEDDSNDEDTIIHSFIKNGEDDTEVKKISITIADYCSSFQTGNSIEVTSVLSSDEYFNGAIGTKASDTWQAPQQTGNSGQNTWTIEFSNVTSDTLEIQIWYMDGTYVDLETLTITKKDTDSTTYENQVTDNDNVTQEESDEADTEQETNIANLDATKKEDDSDNENDPDNEDDSDNEDNSETDDNTTNKSTDDITETT